jgi:hypothetical protein
MNTQPHHTALDLFGKRREMHRQIILVVLLMTVIHGAAYWHLASKIGNKPQILLMDDNTFYLPKALDFADAKDLHVSQAGLLMESLFDRGPNGLDHSERLKRLCEKSAYKDAMNHIREEAEAFEAKKIHQKFELRSVQLLQAEDNSVLVAIDGQLIRTGAFSGEQFNEALVVKARLLFVRNPSVVINGAFPTLLRSLEIETSPLPMP